MWSFGIYETLTGRPLLDVFPSSGSWRSAFTSVGSGQHTFQLRDPETAMDRAVARDLFTPWSRTLVVLWDGVPVYAGLILRTVYDAGNGVLTVHHSELRLIFTLRHIFMLNEYDPAGKLQVIGKSLRGLVQAVVRAGAWRPEAGPWDLPIQFPADEAGPVSKTWFYYQFMKVEDMLTEVSGMNGAPDFYLQPRLNESGWLFWELVIGTPRLPGATLDLPYSVQASSGTNVVDTTDATKQLTGVFMIGAGSEQDIRVGKGPSSAAVPIPYLDDSRTAKQTDVVTELDSLAAGEVALHEHPLEQFAFNLTHDERNLFNISDVVPGARLRLDIRGDDVWVEDGLRTSYVLGVSGDMTTTLKPEVQAL